MTDKAGLASIEPVAHKPTAALMEALREAGWTRTGSKFPGNVIFSHPLSGTEKPTPDYMRGSQSWPFDTYYELRQLSFNYTGKKIDAVWTRICRAPWVAEDQRKVSFKRAIEFVAEEWQL